MRLRRLGDELVCRYLLESREAWKICFHLQIEKRLQDTRRKVKAGHGTSMLETLTVLGSEPFLSLTAGFVKGDSHV